MPVMKYSEEERKQKLLTGNIQKHMLADQVTKVQMGKYLGCNPDTFGQKVQHPRRFTYPELMLVFKHLHFTDAEILEVTK